MVLTIFIFTLQVEHRYFHSAVGLPDYMAIIGGYTHHRNTTTTILIYKFKCNYWYKLDMAGKFSSSTFTLLWACQIIWLSLVATLTIETQQQLFSSISSSVTIGTN